jgi:hypothetical protein
MATLPTPELLRQRLSLRYRVGVIQLGSEFLAEQRKAAFDTMWAPEAGVRSQCSATLST